MSLVARTNRWLQHAQSLVELENSCSSVRQNDALETSMSLVVEMVLASIVCEVLEVMEPIHSDFNIDHLLSSDDATVSSHWLVKQIKAQRNDPQHWLNQWWLSRRSLSQLTQPVQHIEQPDVGSLIAVNNKSSASYWLDGCYQLVSEARALNSYE